MIDLDEPIAEARRRLASDPLVMQIVDALVSVRAERDAALARIAELEEKIGRAERMKAAHMRSSHETGKYNEELLARIAEAAKLHRKGKHWNSDREYVFVCDECTRINRYGIAHWPCPTAVSLGLNEGENDG